MWWVSVFDFACCVLLLWFYACIFGCICFLLLVVTGVGLVTATLLMLVCLFTNLGFALTVCFLLRFCCVCDLRLCCLGCYQGISCVVDVVALVIFVD